jgi:predicted regulator of Ras-like GTPase activity (Roadblock/LC7/MglB family)
MNPALWAWMLSVVGAALFFVAGLLWALRRGAREAERGRAVLRSQAEELARAHDEREQLRAALADLELGALAETTRERDELRDTHSKVQRVARKALARAGQAERQVEELVTELRTKPKGHSSLPPPVVDAGARSEALRNILDQETSGYSFTGAVITDDQGLIVASTGEYGDALAAYGAFLAGVGERSRSELPLHELRQVVIQDDHDATLTVRPLASADDHLALVTLALGRSYATNPVRAAERSS